jgi:hypothetical protein
MDAEKDDKKQEKSWPKWVQEAESAIGREYAPEFIEVLSHQGFEVFRYR